MTLPSHELIYPFLEAIYRPAAQHVTAKPVPPFHHSSGKPILAMFLLNLSLSSFHSLLCVLLHSIKQPLLASSSSKTFIYLKTSVTSPRTQLMQMLNASVCPFMINSSTSTSFSPSSTRIITYLCLSCSKETRATPEKGFSL